MEPAPLPYLSGLPEDLLVRILGNLQDLCDLQKASHVSKVWHELIHAGQWMGIQELICHRYLPTTPAGIQWTTTHCRNVLHADLSYCCALGHEELSALSSLPLRSCRIAHWHNLTALPSGSPAMFQNLELLDISYTAIRLSPFLALTLGQAVALQDLRLAGLRCSDRAFLHDLAQHCPGLKCLNLAKSIWCHRAAAILFESFEGLASLSLSDAECELSLHWSPAALTSIDLSGTSVSDFHISNMFHDSHQLKRLCLCGCCKIQGWGLEAYGQAGQAARLSKVDLSQMQISATILASFLSKSCRSTQDDRDLELGFSACCDDGCVLALLSSMQPASVNQASVISALTRVTLSPSCQPTSAIEQASSHPTALQCPYTAPHHSISIGQCRVPSCLPDILELSVRDSSKISMHALGTLAAAGSLSRLRALDAIPSGVTELTLAGCDSIRGEGLCRLSSLQILRLPGCQAVTLQNLQATISACQSMRLLEPPHHLRMKKILLSHHRGL
ncbi:hypothetical protein WJX74_010833 [Apatococcus lobatus]|uniref:F-box domain-containing protein n=1 Tax=Apatococcus lobatus TaxID=904363 RepID=A0AAW1R2B1_9CHLO